MVCGEIQKDPLCTFTGHGLLWNTDRERPLLTLEWLRSHGIPACPGLCGHKRPLVDFHRLLMDAQVLPGEVQSMVGNGWHLLSMGQWTIFWLASTLHRGQDKSPPQPCLFTIADDEEPDNVHPRQFSLVAPASGEGLGDASSTAEGHMASPVRLGSFDESQALSGKGQQHVGEAEEDTDIPPLELSYF